MTKQMEFKHELKPFEKIEQEIVFDNDKEQVYFELKKGSPKMLLTFLDDDNKEVLSKDLPQSAFIKPYTNKAKLYIVNTSEKESTVSFRLVVGVRRI